ncbi:hypothetical protein AB0G73_22080 [Streptomyces sp. NPDC020719]|uniref:hypothetical protein n=1 Tax=unclassified Streptomyces TaxID=2593676 RepID=UPI00340DED43
MQTVSELAGQEGLAAGLSAIVTWITLTDRCHGKGRLLGSVHAAALASAVCLLMAAAAGAGAYLLPLASHLPAATFALVGAGVTRRGRRQQEGVSALTTVLSLGVARLLVRLEERLALDRADWCDRLMEMDGPKDRWRAQRFMDDVAHHLRERWGSDKTKAKHIEERYREAVDAFARSAQIEARIDTACAEDRREWTGLRARTDAEKHESRRAHGTALHHCKLLLHLAHEYGRRTDDRAVERLWRASQEGNATAALPSPRRPFLHRVLRRSAERSRG